MARVRLGIYLGEDGPKLGRGKIGLLRAIREHGSISAAARSMGMAYRHAWTLVNELNRCFAEPVVVVTIGGREGGGAKLTPWGDELVASFEQMEQVANESIEGQLAALERRVAPRRPARSGKRSPGASARPPRTRQGGPGATRGRDPEAQG